MVTSQSVQCPPGLT